MGNPKIISYTPEMLIKENLERGVKKELLSKIDGQIKSIQGSVQKSDNKNPKIEISEWCKKLRTEDAHLYWVSENEVRKRKIEEIEMNFNCCWEDKFKEACESYNYETAAESINLDASDVLDWAEHLGIKLHYKKPKHKEYNVLESDLFDNAPPTVKQEMSDWCKALRSNESHLNWMKKSEMIIRKIEEIERNFGCYWEDKFKEVCESYNLETAASAIDLDEAIFKNWAKHLNLNFHDKKSEVLEGAVLDLRHVNKENILETEVLNQTPLEALPLSVRAKNALDDIGVKTLGECRKLTFNELCLLRNVGKKSANEIIRVVGDIIQGKERILDYKPEEIRSLDESYLINVLSLPLSEIKLSVRATNVISNLLGNKRIINLVRLERNEILSLQNCGSSTLQEIDELLLELGLRLNMRISDELKDKVKEFKDQNTVEQIIDNFKKSYPGKYAILLKAYLKKTPQSRMNQYEECFRLYQEGGTLEYVGKKLNLTRERIRQILKKGTQLGIFNYTGRDYVYFEKEKILKDYQELLSLQKVAEFNKVSPVYLRKILTAYKVSGKRLREIGVIARKNKCIEEYQQIVSKLGHHPTTTELQGNNVSRALSVRILRFWGNIDNFRQELNIPKVVRIYPEKSRQSLEKWRRLGFIIRMENLDKIRGYLSSSGVASTIDIAYACNLRSPKTGRLLNLLIARGEVVREGNGSATKYKINEVLL